MSTTELYLITILDAFKIFLFVLTLKLGVLAVVLLIAGAIIRYDSNIGSDSYATGLKCHKLAVLLVILSTVVLGIRSLIPDTNEAKDIHARAVHARAVVYQDEVKE